MHLFDPNGSIRAYRRERDRRDNCRTMLFVIGIVCGLVAVTCAAFITLSLWGG